MAIADFPFICLDVANGYMTKFIDTIKRVREKYFQKIIIAGNVAEYRGAYKLSEVGVDIIKVGIGSGSVCTTRKITGVGYPQISAIDECEKIALVGNRYIMSDGGCVVPGDISKAYVAGADFVMLGGMLAAHDECQTTEFYGMSSERALDAFSEKSNYRAAEGKIVNLKSRGPVTKTLDEIMGGIRSAGAYIGCDTLDRFSNASLIHVAEQTNDVYGD
jgi:GMP reductase